MTDTVKLLVIGSSMYVSIYTTIMGPANNTIEKIAVNSNIQIILPRLE